MKRILLLTALSLMFVGVCSAKKHVESEGETAARGVIERTLGIPMKNLVLKVTGPDAEGQDYFSHEVRKGVLTVSGSTPVTVCRGFYDYVKQNGYGLLTWSSNNISLPKKLAEQPLRKVVTPFEHRVYMNVVTMGYTHPFKDWKGWEQELDWMAMHGFDMPLSPIGSEAIFARVWRDMGLTEEEINEFVTGPAHLPWFRMGNMTKLDSPLSQAYYDQTIALEHKMMDRMLSLGMKPLCNGFAGFVPKAISRLYPDAKLIETGWKHGKYYYSSYIEPTSDLFQEIAARYLKAWEQEYGKCEYYLIDSFNEMEVPFAKKGTQERFDQIAAYGKSVYESVTQVNPDATWVLQGWMFGYQRGIWDPESIRAFFHDVPDDKVMLIDLACDFNHGIWHSEYLWNYAPKVYNQKWIYSTVPNFGGRSCPMGDLEFYLNGHLNAFNSENRGNMCGFGTSPEGVENNEVIYEAISDAAWNTEEVDVHKWLGHYTALRYGECPEELAEFWAKMLNTSYSICSARAQYRVQKRPYSISGGKYDVSPEHFEAIESFVAAADQLGDNPEYKTDLAMWAGFYAIGKADLLAARIHRCYITGDEEQAELYEKEFVRLLRVADRFMESYPLFRIERWIDMARAWGTTDAEKEQYETNARRLLTTWGPGHGETTLNDYACRVWSGVIRDYYVPRWENYFAAKKEGRRFDFGDWEWKYVEEQRGCSPVEPFEDIVAAARELVSECRIMERVMPAIDKYELGGWSSTEMENEKTNFYFVLNTDQLDKFRGVRIKWQRGEDAVALKRLQLNAGGWVRFKNDYEDVVIDRNNPVFELKLDKKPCDKKITESYLHINLGNTKLGGDSYALVELITE